MNLHRVLGTSDWADVPAAKRNSWQKVAASTNGIVTIGNFFSLLGLLSVPLGLWLVIAKADFIWAAVVFALGRLCDLADGALADRTGTKSPLGEKIDATFDKLSTAGTVIGLLLAKVLPWPLVLILLLPHAVIAVMALLAYLKGQGLHPSQMGKLSMAAGWAFILIALFSIGLGSMAQNVHAANIVWDIALFVLAVSFIMAVSAMSGYAREVAAVYRKPK